MRRRNFILTFLAGTIIPPAIGLLSKLPFASGLKRYLRPPGALPETAFLDACIGCGQCASVCPNKCISMYGMEAGFENLATPKINPRARACILCMACTQVCPTGALKPLEATPEGMATVNMGKAVVTTDLCYSYNKRTCGACYRACPLPGKAMKLGLYETPIVNIEQCVGCGLCEQACIHMPQAIRVIPQVDYEKHTKGVGYGSA